MGMTDGYKNESGFGPGPKELTVLSVKFVKSQNTGTDGFEITYCVGSSYDHPVRKTLWYSKKLFNRFLTSWMIGLELNPFDLEQASKEGRGDEFLLAKFPGRHGVFQFVETDNVNEKTGRKYLEPKSKAEIDFDIWIKEQEAVKQASNDYSTGQRVHPAQVGGSDNLDRPADYPDDVPW